MKVIKVLQISGFYKGKDKYGNEQYQIEGFAYEKNNNFVGTPVKRLWVRANLLTLSESDIRKDLYLMYNDKGWVIKAEVK